MKKLSKETLKLAQAAEEAVSSLLDALNEDVEKAQEFFDAKSQKWQESDKGSQYQDFITEIESIRDNIDSLREYLESASSVEVGGE